MEVGGYEQNRVDTPDAEYILYGRKNPEEEFEYVLCLVHAEKGRILVRVSLHCSTYSSRYPEVE